jgi:putative DNA primase/helicase
VARTNGFQGIGYVFSPQDDYAGVDLDHCRDLETGEIEPWARANIDRLQSYTEKSPSGTGLHILIKGKVPTGGNKKGKVEMYSQGRFFTMTGDHLGGTPLTIEPRQTELETLHREVFGKPKDAPKPASPGPALELSDRELIEKAQTARNGDKFSRLWRGDTTGYGSPSEAAAALLNHLVFWCRPDPARIDRLFRQSGLMREKWDRPQSGSTWGGLEIQKAINRATEFYTPGQRPPDLSPQATPAPEAPMSPPQTEENQPPLKVVKIPAITSNRRSNFNLTDLGNGQRLVARHGNDLRYCYPWGKWLIYDGQRWAKDESGEVDRRAKETVRNIYAEAATIKDKDSRAAMADHAKRSESDSKRQAMINSARSEPGIPLLPDALDRDPWLLNVLNGTLDLRTAELRAHRQEELISKLAPVKFDREAECATWWKFLKRIFNRDSDVILFIQKAVGYALTGITRDQCLFFLYGLGANGKSTFLEVIQTMLGDYATQTTSETFMLKRHGSPISNDVADLRGARFVSAVEIESGRRMAEVLIKQMTGGDKIKARFLYSEHFEFKPEFKIFLAANHKPVIQGTDIAIWRRIRLIPFTVQIPETEQDRELPDKLKAELPGILNWAIEGCINWQDHGLAPPQAVQDATQNYRQEMDTLADFMAECCILAPEASALAAELYKAYTAWAEESGEKKPLSQKSFGTALGERGFERGRGIGGKKTWKGIGLNH